MKRRTMLGLGVAMALMLVPNVAVADPPVAAGDQPGAGQPAPSPRVLSAMARDLGLSADQARARLAREATGPELARKVRTALGSRFGGAWHAEDGRLHVGITKPADADAVRAAGAVPVRVARSEAALNQVKETLDRHLGTAPEQAIGWFVDLPANTVTVTSKPAKAATEAWLAATGTAGQVRIVTSAQEVRPLYNLRAGEAYRIGSSRCSTGSACPAASSRRATATS